MSKIPDISLRMTAERIDREQLKMFFETINTELSELLILGSYDFRMRALKTISKHPEWFSCRFSLDFIMPVNSLHGICYTVTMRYGAVKSTTNNDYYEIGFWLKIEERIGHIVTASCRADMSSYSPSGVSTLDKLIDWAVEKVNPENPDLVIAHLYQGVQGAFEKIKYSVCSAAVERNLRRADTRSLFANVQSYRIGEHARDKMIASLKLDNMEVGTRVSRLEGAIGSAIEEIAGTKNITKSPTLEAIRERLESALNEGEPEEEERCGAP